MPNPTPVVFTADKDTKNKRRFSAPEGAPVQGSIYLNLSDVGTTQTVTVNVTLGS